MTGVITRKRLLHHKGRRGGDSRPYAYLPVELLTSPAVRTLPHVAHRVLVGLAAQYTGRGNGSLTFTRRTARDYGITDHHTLGAALAELETRGLVIRTRPGSRIPPRATLYALAWWPIHDPLAHDPHDARPTAAAPDNWRSWTMTASAPHWTIARRATRWRVAPSERGASPRRLDDMRGASPLMQASGRGAHDTTSHYLGRGRSA
jgi:hypothetical protein